MLIPHSTERPWANGERHALHIYAMIYHSYIIGKWKSKKLKLLDVLMEKQEIWGKDFPLRKILSCLLPFTTKLLYPLSVGNIHIVSFFFMNVNEVQGILCKKEDKACPLLVWLLKTKVLLRKDPVQFRDWWISDNRMISSYFWHFSKISLLFLFKCNCWMNNLEVHHNFL